MNRAERWLPDVIAGAAAFVIGLLEIGRSYDAGRWPALVVVIGVAVAVGLSRRLPAAALAVAWGTGIVQVAVGVDPMLTEMLLAVVAFGCARWGWPPTVWLSGLSIPLSAVIAVLMWSPYAFYDALRLLGVDRLAIDSYSRYDWRLAAGLVGFALLATPWLLGLALRFAARSQDSRRSQVAAEAQRDQAEEIARLREEQAQLARDVHDVVGHSLAVILAQAESAQYLEDADTQGLKTTMANIAGSARSSLEDVRQVLSSTSDTTTQAAQQTDLDSLVDGVRASGHEVVTTEVGTPQPMPPELAVVAFRVLQEMLTNAIKHGRRDQPVHVERHWEGDLRIEVQNAVLPGDSPGGGQGLDGMRRRLEAVGGRLDVRRRADPPTFTATAWVPVRNR
ncbi:sensor histidine kinase [Nocardioides sp. SLBN-35]|uniref:sensor histidine kinase n=1 Tax=Nocardioides sp. SLBN-35 TaxID=2768445 RepID=UPI001151488E|nr:histidine kinase [Nocardioides sp. SLBN-35]TQK68668.1 signal transduction histidine kinase [Nocardioides sp. SLBN-35]